MKKEIIDIANKDGSIKSFAQYCKESEEYLLQINPNYISICNEDGSFKTPFSIQFRFLYKKYKILVYWFWYWYFNNEFNNDFSIKIIRYLKRKISLYRLNLYN